jgi:hypothetical protein
MKTGKDYDSYFGGCPECGGTGCLNIGPDHWFVCHDHKTKWCVGSNLFDSWREQDETMWRDNQRKLADYIPAKSLNTHERDGRELAREPAKEAARPLNDFLDIGRNSLLPDNSPHDSSSDAPF